MKYNSKMWWYGVIGMVIIGIDRSSKFAALYWCDMPEKIISCISCHVTLNRGISWGMLNSENTIIFFVVSSVITSITIFFAYHTYKQIQAGYNVIGEICVIAGSFSNIIDRLYYSGVIDFILISYKNLIFPIFNVADIAIVCGVGIMVIKNYWD